MFIALLFLAGGDAGAQEQPEKPSATPQQIAFVEQNGQEPVEMVLRALREGDVRLVGLGEQHRADAMEALGRSVVEAAAGEQLLDFLALEIDERFQEDMDLYLETGEVSPRLQVAFDKHHENYRQMLELARANGLNILCSDIRMGDRDAAMSENILEYMEQHPDEVGIYYAGNAHVTEHNGDLLTAGLGEAYYSVYQLRSTDRSETVADAARQAGITASIGLNGLDGTVLGEAIYGYFAEDRAPFEDVVDAIVIHPPQRSW